MTEHVTRVETLEVIGRYNELERIVPILVQALERIADDPRAGPYRKIADRALRDALETRTARGDQ